jgi:hypothetical protein
MFDYHHVFRIEEAIAVAGNISFFYDVDIKIKAMKFERKLRTEIFVIPTIMPAYEF